MTFQVKGHISLSTLAYGVALVQREIMLFIGKPKGRSMMIYIYMYIHIYISIINVYMFFIYIGIYIHSYSAINFL